MMDHLVVNVLLSLSCQMYFGIHRSTQTCIEHSLAVFATISHDY